MLSYVDINTHGDFPKFKSALFSAELFGVYISALWHSEIQTSNQKRFQFDWNTIFYMAEESRKPYRALQRWNKDKSQHALTSIHSRGDVNPAVRLPQHSHQYQDLKESLKNREEEITLSSCVIRDGAVKRHTAHHLSVTTAKRTTPGLSYIQLILLCICFM